MFVFVTNPVDAGSCCRWCRCRHRSPDHRHHHQRRALPQKHGPQVDQAKAPGERLRQ